MKHLNKFDKTKPKNNITRNDIRALTHLKQDKDFIITKADKGNIIVIMDYSEYEQKMKAIISDEIIYKKLGSDPTKKHDMD